MIVRIVKEVEGCRGHLLVMLYGNFCDVLILLAVTCCCIYFSGFISLMNSQILKKYKIQNNLLILAVIKGISLIIFPVWYFVDTAWISRTILQLRLFMRLLENGLR